MAIDKTKVLKAGQLLVDRETDPKYNVLYIGDGVTAISGLKPVGAGLELPPNDDQVYALQNGKWVSQAIVDEGDAPIFTPIPALALDLGYPETLSEELIITGTSPITITDIGGPAEITFDSVTRKFTVAPGLAVATHAKVIEATNSVGSEQYTFNAVVTNPAPLPTLTGTGVSGVTVTTGSGMYMQEWIVNNGTVVSATTTCPKCTLTKQNGDTKVLVSIMSSSMSGAQSGNYGITIKMTGPGGNSEKYIPVTAL